MKYCSKILHSKMLHSSHEICMKLKFSNYIKMNRWNYSWLLTFSQLGYSLIFPLGTWNENYSWKFCCKICYFNIPHIYSHRFKCQWITVVKIRMTKMIGIKLAPICRLAIWLDAWWNNQKVNVSISISLINVVFQLHDDIQFKL